MRQNRCPWIGQKSYRNQYLFSVVSDLVERLHELISLCSGQNNMLVDLLVIVALLVIVVLMVGLAELPRIRPREDPLSEWERLEQVRSKESRG